MNALDLGALRKVTEALRGTGRQKEEENKAWRRGEVNLWAGGTN